MPFSEEIDAGIGARSAAISYGSAADSLRQKFTGYQKDEETSLDFAEARMYENRYGRFTAVDPLLASGKSANPQTFNRYAYVGNNPILLVDKDGLIWGINDKNQVRWFGKKLGAGFSEFRPDNWQYVGKQNRIVQLDPNSAHWDFVDPVIVDASVNPFQELGINVDSGLHDAKVGMPRGAGNFLIDSLNFCTDLAINGARNNGVYIPAMTSNPLAIEPYSFENNRQASYGSATEIGLGVSTTFAGAPFVEGAATSVVPKSFTLTGNRLSGLEAEIEYGITASKRSIDALTGTALRRFPDEITETTMTEIKNVAHLNRTNQIVDMHLWAQQEGLQFTIVTRPNTTFSKPMQELFDSGLIRHQVYNFRSRP
jgi:RHS repeat-associated protein